MGTQYTNYFKKQSLGQINRQAAKMRTPTRKNAPSAALEIIHDLIPLALALQETASNAYNRLKLMTQISWTSKKPQPDPTTKILKKTLIHKLQAYAWTRRQL